MEELIREFEKASRDPLDDNSEAANVFRDIAKRVAEIHITGRTGDLMRRGLAVAAAIVDYADFFENIDA